jgi:hypothetical protein
MSNPRLASTARKRSRLQETAERLGEALTAIGRFLLRDRLSTSTVTEFDLGQIPQAERDPESS